MLAGELLTGEAVGVEIRLPQAVNPLRTRALVRHQDKLRMGLEFIGLSAEQQAAIREWVSGAKAELDLGERARGPVEAGKGSEIGADGTGSNGSGSDGTRPPAGKRSTWAWVFLLCLVSAAISLAVVWWRWNRGWEELESGLQKGAKIAEPQTAQVQVPAEVMAKLITHRVDPEYPAAARSAKLQGVIALDVVVGRDGSVIDVHAVNGPEVLAQAAMEALRWWRFEPYRVDGQPVVVKTTVAVEFRP